MLRLNTITVYTKFFTPSIEALTLPLNFDL